MRPVSSRPLLHREAGHPARVERNGELFYVLLMGIYEDADRARRAVDSLPDEIGGAEPWIRPLGSLQSAMLRADRLAGSKRY